MSEIPNLKEEAAKRALHDIRTLLGNAKVGSGDSDESSMDNRELIELLMSNFSKLDPNNDGISRQELLYALTNSEPFSLKECEMLRLIAKYFDTIINLSDDEDGEELKISRKDAEVLSQFLLSSNMTIVELHQWCQYSDEPGNFITPPPLSGQA